MQRSALNAPMFIYSILYDKPAPFMPGRSASHIQKAYKGIFIDKLIPDDAIAKLFLIDGITTRSSCQGEDDMHPTFLIFRPNNQNDEYVKSIVTKLNNYTDIKAGYGKGSEGLYRIGVTTNLWHDKDPILYRRWWKQLPKRIKDSL